MIVARSDPRDKGCAAIRSLSHHERGRNEVSLGGFAAESGGYL
jgi:hypothetical protein